MFIMMTILHFSLQKNIVRDLFHRNYYNICLFDQIKKICHLDIKVCRCIETILYQCIR